jgi:hypothetical protein
MILWLLGDLLSFGTVSKSDLPTICNVISSAIKGAQDDKDKSLAKVIKYLLAWYSGDNLGESSIGRTNGSLYKM